MDLLDQHTEVNHSLIQILRGKIVGVETQKTLEIAIGLIKYGQD